MGDHLIHLLGIWESTRIGTGETLLLKGSVKAPVPVRFLLSKRIAESLTPGVDQQMILQLEEGSILCLIHKIGAALLWDTHLTMKDLSIGILRCSSCDGRLTCVWGLRRARVWGLRRARIWVLGLWLSSRGWGLTSIGRQMYIPCREDVSLRDTPRISLSRLDDATQG